MNLSKNQTGKIVVSARNKAGKSVNIGTLKTRLSLAAAKAAYADRIREIEDHFTGDTKSMRLSLNGLNLEIQAKEKKRTTAKTLVRKTSQTNPVSLERLADRIEKLAGKMRNGGTISQAEYTRLQKMRQQLKDYTNAEYDRLHQNPSEPIGTATEKVYTYWRTPRFKKDRAWLEEHLGQQRLFEYNPAVVRVESVGGGKYGVLVGNQLIGKPTTKEIAQRRVRAMKATAQKFAAKVNPVRPTITIAERKKKNAASSALHITQVGNRNWVVMLGKYRLKSGFKTAAAAELYIASILKRRRNPHSPKLAAKAAQAFMHSFDVDSDGDLDHNDIRILEQFNDASVVVDDDEQRIGTVLGKLPGGDLHIQWGDDSTSTEDPDDVFKVNGLRAWRIRRKKIGRKNPAFKGQREFNELRVKLREIAAAKKATPEQIDAAFKAGAAAGYSDDETWSLIKAAWGKTKARPPARFKGNPGLLSAFAELMVGTASALQVKDHLDKAKKRTAKKTAVRRSSVKRNPDAFTEFQGRTPTQTLELETPPGTPKRLWNLGRLLEIRVVGYGVLDLRSRKFLLCADERNRQMYIAGPPIVSKQDFPDGHTLPLGEISHVVYETEKSHLGDAAGEPSAYIHKLGEEGGARPVLAVDKSGYGHIEGGDYEITPLGIRD